MVYWIFGQLFLNQNFLVHSDQYVLFGCIGATFESNSIKITRANFEFWSTAGFHQFLVIKIIGKNILRNGLNSCFKLFKFVLPIWAVSYYMYNWLDTKLPLYTTYVCESKNISLVLLLKKKKSYSKEILF